MKIIIRDMTNQELVRVNGDLQIPRVGEWVDVPIPNSPFKVLDVIHGFYKKSRLGNMYYEQMATIRLETE